MASRAGPSTGRVRPAPNSASTTRPAPASAAGPTGITSPCQARAAPAASPFSRARSPISATRTAQPACSSSLATTKPSPPLLPGPQRTVTGTAAKRAMIASATDLPAFSISVGPGTPAAAAAASAAAICSMLSTPPSRHSDAATMAGHRRGHLNRGSAARGSHARSRPRPGDRYRGVGAGTRAGSPPRPPARRPRPRRRRPRRRPSRAGAATSASTIMSQATSSPSSLRNSSAQFLPTVVRRSWSKPRNTGR